MCGIFAYAGHSRACSMRELIELAVNGLRRLEYRGYDSAGLCVDDPVTAAPAIVRKTGNVQALHDAAIGDNAAALDLAADATGNSVIAHTRWATHGPPCDRNAHPQSSGAGHEFVVVHNGIMTNFHEMRRFFEAKGAVFSSDTDTEVIAMLAQYLYDESGRRWTFVQVVTEVMRLTKGASAMVFKSTHFPGELVACKRGSPMVVGLRPLMAGAETPKKLPQEFGTAAAGQAECEVFIASDTAPIIEHTKQVVYLDDDDVIAVRQGHVSFYNVKRVDSEIPMAEARTVQEVELELEALSKGPYPHFMLKEIHEQPDAVMNAMRGRLNAATAEVTMGGFRRNIRLLRCARRLVFIACGTSLNACLAVRQLFEELGGVPVAVENASDFLDREPPVFRDDCVVFVSQSGETADTLRAMEYCATFGAVLVGITNTVGSAISRGTHFGAHLNCGPEIGVASTKAYTAQIVTLALVALMMSEDSVAKRERRLEIAAALQKLPDVVRQTLLDTDEAMKALAARMAGAKSVLVLGRGYHFATCMEAALKVKELTYIHTEGINSGELKHGPLALIDENIPVIVFCPNDGVVDRVRPAVQQIRARNGRPWVVLTTPDAEIEALADHATVVPPTVDCLQSVVNVVPMQLLAYYTAIERGNNVDCPRNIAKSVTVQ